MLSPAPALCTITLRAFGPRGAAPKYRKVAVQGQGGNFTYLRTGETVFDCTAFVMADFWKRLFPLTLFPSFQFAEQTGEAAKPFSNLPGALRAVQAMHLPLDLPPYPPLRGNRGAKYNAPIRSGQALELQDWLNLVTRSAQDAWQRHQAYLAGSTKH